MLWNDPASGVIRHADAGYESALACAGGASKATSIQAGICDPVARNLVEWAILNSDNNGVTSKRYLASSPPIRTGRASAMFSAAAPRRVSWTENPHPAQVAEILQGGPPPQSGMGRLVLARALLAHGDTDGASALVREVWRGDALTVETEKQALQTTPVFLEPGRSQGAHGDAAAPPTTKPRCGRRAASRAPTLRSRRRASRSTQRRQGHSKDKKTGQCRKLLDAVPAEARNDPGYPLRT